MNQLPLFETVQRVFCTVLAVGCLLSCGQRNQEILPSSPNPTSTETTTNLDPILPLLLCLENEEALDANGYPVDVVMADWNNAGTNVLTRDSKDCSGWLVFRIEDTPGYYGTTQFSYYRFVEIKLNPSTPVGLRRHVLCHEVGHGLGVPHNKAEDSCMTDQPYVYPESPTPVDLQVAGSTLWEWNKISRQAMGH